jgi:hypothetical protein
MQLIVVAKEDLADLARKLIHCISQIEEHSASFWTDKHYKDNEATLSGKQHVIFLGENEVSKSYSTILPERFSACGTKCYWGGSKALLTVKPLDIVNMKNLEEMSNVVKGKQAEISMKEYINNPEMKGFFDDFIHIAAWIYSPLSELYKYVSNKKRKIEYEHLQLDYVLVRFFDEEFSPFLAMPEAK